MPQTPWDGNSECVSALAVLGERCLNPGVVVWNVGDLAPILGDDVYVGANAVIVGGIRVADMQSQDNSAAQQVGTCGL